MSGFGKMGALGWRRYTRRERAAALCVVAAVAAIVSAAWALEPDPRGLGTHEQLGLAPCRMLTGLGIPCPFCGMTTAFALLAQGDFSSAFLAQPAGVILFGAFLAIASLAAIAGASGQGLRPKVIRSFSPPLAAALLSIVCMAWIYKVFRHLG